MVGYFGFEWPIYLSLTVRLNVLSRKKKKKKKISHFVIPWKRRYKALHIFYTIVDHWNALSTDKNRPQLNNDRNRKIIIRPAE